jgi:hypothetical protein
MNCPGCGKGLVAEPIYWRMEPHKSMKRMIVARVPYCYGCGKPQGHVRPEVKTPKITGPDWELMMQFHPKPPFIFELKDNTMVPEGFDLAAFQRSRNIEPGRRPSLAPQERAAGELLPDSEEPEREPEE